jgi:cysteine-rich repeat protein
MRLVYCFALMGMLVACTGAGDVVDKADGAADASRFEEIAAEVTVDVTVDTGESAPELPWSLDLPDLLEPEVVGPECLPGEGCFLDPCQENGDCLSGWCVEHLGDAVCTQSCQEECPPGWSCKQTGSGGPDVAFVCVSNVANLCKPCAGGADCKSVGGNDDLCVSYGTQGSFCGGSCATDNDCPWGFSCQTTVTVDGIDAMQCVADAGVCPCTAKSVSLALWTPCAVDNDAGTCTGKRVCTDAGLSDCDASEPAGETCNGIDDDCDGSIDEPNDVGGDTVPLCDDGNECTTDLCDAEVGCIHTKLDEGECKDGDSCTVGDHCEAGICIGLPVKCDDGNPCTDDSCDGLGGCVAVPNQADCDDNDPCTVADRCQDHQCSGTPIPCDCQADEDCAALEDGNLCNGTLHCDLANWPYKCVVEEETEVLCTGPEPGPDAICLQPLCNPDMGDCSLVAANDGFACDDGNACTVGEHCSEGSCVGGVAPICNDDNPCTDDSCDPDGGCLYTANSAICSDGDVCTTLDLCADGNCIGGPPLVCDDGNACNGEESCDSAQGCKSGTPLTCDDGNTCNGPEGCDPAIGCTSGSALQCDDGNPCTVDSCDPESGCAHETAAGECDDNNACTVGDHCDSGQCTYSGLLSCDDDNVCTSESCDPKAGCIYLMNDAPCDDGDVCTLGDHCNLGSCISTGDLLCDDGNACSDDSCSPQAGCQFVPNSNPCDDGNACTQEDKCVAKACKGTVPVSCDDEEPCTLDACDAALGCLHTAISGECDDSDACTTGDTCADGICVGGAPLPCNDSNICTDDTCDPEQGCLFVPNVAACDDEDECTTDSVCSGGGCVGSGELACDVSAYCAANSCLPECFTAACDADTGCFFTAVVDCCGNGITDGEEECDDGNSVDGDGCTAQCASEGPPGPYYKLTGLPDPAKVFDSITVTFKYPNNLTNGIWHYTSNTILVGHYSYTKHWQHPADANSGPSSPNVGSGHYGRMVHMPGTRMVAFTDSPDNDGMGTASASQLRLATIDPNSGVLGSPMAAQFSDGYSGTCNVLSSSVTEVMIFDGSNHVRRYETTSGSAVLTLSGVITLSPTIPANATCNGGHCYGGTFAWDGHYFYFTMTQTGSDQRQYRVYNESGVHVGDYTAAGSGGINGTYFDWNVGRYATHDGYGSRQGGSIYSIGGGTDDSQCYGPVSSYHTLVP